MKNSNIQWIGEIPDDWEVSKFKYVSKMLYGYPFDSDKFSNYEGFPLIRIRDITSGKIETFFNGVYPKEYIVSQGDILIGMDGDFNIRVWNNVDALLNQRCCKIQNNTSVSSKYLFYFLTLQLKITNDLTWSTTVKHLLSSTIDNISIVVPPLATQTSIATYLDAKCSEIHGLIADINKQIETLNELKKSTITEAVTKGLNKNAKLKDGGIQWIGMIPEGWRVTKLKYLGKFINGYAFDSKLFCNDGVQVVKISNIQPGYLSLEDKSYVSTVYYKQLTQYRVEKNDIVFALTRPVINGGIKTAIVYENCKLLLNQRTAMFKGNNKMLSKWLFYLMQCNYFVFEFINLIDFTGLQPNISTNDISNIDVPYISIEEQRDIATYLDTKCSEFDSIISDKQKQISTLEAYKKSLIYEYVTGKKEVES